MPSTVAYRCEGSGGAEPFCSRNLEDGPRREMLLITAAGLDAIGVDSAGRPDAAEGRRGARGRRQGRTCPWQPRGPCRRAGRGFSAPHSAPCRARPARGQAGGAGGDAAGPEGATIAEIVAVTGWQPHTVRGALAGALKKRLGLEVDIGEDRRARTGLRDRVAASSSPLDRPSHFSAAGAVADLPIARTSVDGDRPAPATFPRFHLAIPTPAGSLLGRGCWVAYGRRRLVNGPLLC